MDHSIGIRHFLIFTRTSLMRAASFAASQSARRWSDGEKAYCFFAVRSDANGESRGGLSPPRAPKTVREPLNSHGFRCSAADIEDPPMGKERWSDATNPRQPLFCSPGTTAQTFELPSRPAD